jgi:ABC-type transport system, involved in lipoprotein release, permease component
MFKTDIKIAWRCIVRNKSFSFINITGLAIGISASLLLYIVVRYELSYDTFQQNYHRIYRVVSNDKFGDGETFNSGIPVPALDALKAEIPQVQFAPLFAAYGTQITVPSANNPTGDKYIEETGVFFSDPGFFDIFNYQWLAGNPEVLTEPNSIVLSKKTATKYFGSWQKAMGQTIVMANAVPMKVNGVLNDVPANTDFPLYMVGSFKTARYHAEVFYLYDTWRSTSSNFHIYALLPEKVSAQEINQALLQFSNTHYSSRKHSTKTNFLQPLSTLHFDNRFETLGDHIVSKNTLMTLTIIGIFILLMACVNFINLSTALSVTRSKEVGIRKVLGGSRSLLFWQVMGETAVIVGIAIVVAFALVYLTLPYIKLITSIPETISPFQSGIIGPLLLLGCLVTFLAGVYPSFVLSKYNPIAALKNKFASASVQGISLRSSLVVMQFAISQVLIIATAVAVSQMNFVRKAELGFNKEAVLLLTGTVDSNTVARQQAFKQQLLQIPGVQSVNFCFDAPSSYNNWSTNFAYDHRPDEKYQVSLKFTDADYVETFGLHLIAGHNMAQSDTTKDLLINETLVKKLGVKDANEVIGKTLRINEKWYPIAGVVKDFKTSSLKEEIQPIVMLSSNLQYGITAVKIRSANLATTQAAIQKVWDGLFPEYAFSPAWFDENISEFYDQENKLALLYQIFAGLAIFISCLGLYGLVSLMTVQKTKEVGIRKVLGASVGSLVKLFSKEFTILIIISFFIAVPVAWFMMSNWLNNFVFRISLNLGFFAIAIICSILVAWISVGYKALLAAMANPIKSLRTE